MSGDDLAELLRALVEQQRAEAASARAAHTLAEAEGRAEDDQEAAAEVVQARERYGAAVAAAEAARSRRREIEARFTPRDVDRAHVTLAGGRAGAVAEVTTPPSGRVTIAGRRFTLGAVYEAAPHVRPYEQGRLLPLRLVGYDPAYPWPKGRVEAELVGVRGTRRRTRRLSGRACAAWAGEPVEDVGR